MAAGGGLQVDGDAVAVGEEEVGGDLLAGGEGDLEGVLVVGLVQDAPPDEGLRYADLVAEPAAEAVGVEGDARGVRAVPADLAGLDHHDDRRPGRLDDAQGDEGGLGAGAPVPVLAAPDVAVAGGGRQQDEGRAAVGVGLLAVRLRGLLARGPHPRERAVVDDLAARVERHEVEQPGARTLGHPAQLLQQVRGEVLDAGHPEFGAAGDLVPFESGGLGERGAVERERRLDLGAGGLAVLAAAFAGRPRDLDQRDGRCLHGLPSEVARSACVSRL